MSYFRISNSWISNMFCNLDPSTGKPTDPLISLSQRTADNGAEKASVIYKNGNFYYLFTSWDKCCLGTSSTYNIRVGRSDSYVDQTVLSFVKNLNQLFRVSGQYSDKSGVALLAGGGILVLGTHDNVSDLWRFPLTRLAHTWYISWVPEVRMFRKIAMVQFLTIVCFHSKPVVEHADLDLF